MSSNQTPWRALLAAIVDQHPNRSADGNAPGHAHSRAGIWDDDNKGKGGTACTWCKTWNAAVTALREDALEQAAPEPPHTDLSSLPLGERLAQVAERVLSHAQSLDEAREQYGKGVGSFTQLQKAEWLLGDSKEQLLTSIDDYRRHGNASRPAPASHDHGLLSDSVAPLKMPTELPPEILQAAAKLSMWFAARDLTHWRLADVASKAMLEDCEEALRAARHSLRTISNFADQALS